MYSSSTFSEEHPIRVGLVGTGYAAKLRAGALVNDSRCDLVAIVGYKSEKTAEFAQNYQSEVENSWQSLVERRDIDMVIVSTINRDHGAIARAALESGKHVVVEYPLSLDVEEAEELIAFAKSQKKLLHVEHIELLGGVHQALKQHLPEIGQVFYVRYSTIKPENPAPRKWTYNHQMFGFPLSGALSRLHRLMDLFGKVDTVNCHNRFWATEEEYFQSCLCITQLCFESGLLGQVIYGKGETLWLAERKFEVHGEGGGLVFDGEQGVLITTEGTKPVEVGTRRGLFVKDTTMVLDHLINGTPLYVTASESLYTLKIADAARRAAMTGLTIVMED
ncbi:MAG: Gfo/Idh/MocA family oxidoreductase [Nostocaceae cyanobacterium]|nr:Gfo/Idh/MocA family oxidoreductase [Nostocaceae cyanobacterium]